MHTHVHPDNRPAQMESSDLPAPAWMYGSCKNMNSVGCQCCSFPPAGQDWSLLVVCIYTHKHTFIHTPAADLSHSIIPVAGLRSLVFQWFASAHLNALSSAASLLGLVLRHLHTHAESDVSGKLSQLCCRRSYRVSFPLGYGQVNNFLYS